MALVTPATIQKQRFSPTPLTPNFLKDSGYHDTDIFDVRVLLACKPRDFIWSSSVAIRGGATTRASGKAPRFSTVHTQLAFGIISSLAYVRGEKLSRLKTRNGNKPPSVHILVADEAFADGIRAFAVGGDVQHSRDGFRSVKSLWSELRKQLKRFEITVETTAEDDPRLVALTGWGRSLLAPKGAENVPSVFHPSVVAQIL